MEATAYVRVSSKAQNHATQHSAIERVAAARGDVVTSWYGEKLSGKSLDRPELTRLRGDARAGLIRRLYVYRIDRLARSGIRDTFEVLEDLRAHGVEVVTVADGFDLAGPAAEVVLAVMAWAAKMERLATNERIASARERLEREGRPWGRPPAVTPPQAERARALRDQGMTVRQIAVRLNATRSAVHRALSRKVPLAEAA